MSKLNEQGLAILVEEINRSVNTKINAIEGGGSEIDDSTVTNTTTWSSDKISRLSTEINQAISANETSIQEANANITNLQNELTGQRQRLIISVNELNNLL